MGKRTREIVALVLLVVLGIAVACTMAWYMLVGHNWNQAATHIDDLVGSMDGYTVIVYDGVAKRPKQQAADGSASTRAESSEGSSSAGASSPTSKRKSSKKVKASSVAKSYRKKGASVLVIAKNYAWAYDEPVILLRGGKRVGVFSFTGKYRYSFVKFNHSLHYLQAHDVDSIIAVVDDKSLAKKPPDGVNLLVVMRNAGIPASGSKKGQTFCVDSPYRGEVQVVIVSPSGVVTSRTVSGQ